MDECHFKSAPAGLSCAEFPLRLLNHTIAILEYKRQSVKATCDFRNLLRNKFAPAQPLRSIHEVLSIAWENAAEASASSKGLARDER
jgi:hypothetical protein